VTRISVKASRCYDVAIGSDLLKNAGSMIAEVIRPCKAAIVSDDNVFPLYGAKVEASLRAAGFETVSYVFPHGEASKCLATYGNVLNFLCNNKLTRSDIIVALGGGVVGDLAGFAAATYLRGIQFVQVPTTLLSMVDSSVGGKTAIDLDAGKNQAGCFYQPSLVICDIDTLSTLPEEEYRCGCAEVIKYGVLGNEKFFCELYDTPACEQLEHVITTCVGMKRDVVENDEFDRGERAKLNLGHTVGHAIEAESRFSMLHGTAVAAGMGIVTRAAATKGYCSQETADRVDAILKKYNLPCDTEYTLEQLSGHVLNDKKMSGKSLSLIVPEKIGACRVEKIPVSEFGSWLTAGGVK